MLPSPDILAALGRLNAHARVPAGLWDRSQRDAIYAYKTMATLLLAEAGQLSLRLVRWTGKCIGCTDGIWRDEYDEPRRCRYCERGVRTLRFCETTLPDGQLWHHPWDGGPSPPGFDITRAAIPDFDSETAAWQSVDGHWTPRMPGAALPVDELAGLLNPVEAWIDAGAERARGAPLWWRMDSARRRTHQVKHGKWGLPEASYRLDLGRLPGCFVCGAAEVTADRTYGRLSPLFHWSLRTCAAHRDEPHPTSPPPALLITPAIALWQTRHERVEEVR